MLPGTSTLYINDVGSDWEEINVAAGGVNYGWPVTEGSDSTDPAYTKPLYTYPHGTGVAIAGGSFYTASMFPGRYDNTYFFGDYVAGFIKNLDPATGTVTSFATLIDTPVGLMQAADGSLYVLSHGPSGGTYGGIFRIAFSNQAPTAVATATTPITGSAPLTVSFSGTGSTDPNGDPLTYAWTFGDGTTGSGPSVSHTYAAVGTYNVTLTVNDRPDATGLSHTSQPIVITVVNRVPVANADSATTTQDAPINISVLGNDSDPDGDTLTVSSVTQGAHGAVVVNPDKTVRYTPAANYLGPDTFTYTISDGRGGTATASVAVAVRGVFYLSTTTSGTLASNPGASLSFTDADILKLTVEANGQYLYQMHFDGSDVGLTTANEDIDAFAFLPDGSIVLSTVGTFAVPGPSGTALTGAGEDLLRFIPTSLGSTTSGQWAIYFDGSDVGLGGSAENIDAVAVLSNGRLLISVVGNFTVPGGVSGQDEDLIAFQSTSLGPTTAGSWSLYFDGSDVSLTSADEDLDGLYVRESATPGALPKLFFATLGNFSVPGVSGQDEDLFAFTPTALGASTSGTYGPGLTLDGSRYGLTPFNLDGIYLGALPGQPQPLGLRTAQPQALSTTAAATVPTNTTPTTTAPTKVVAGQPTTFLVTLTNTGDDAWKTSGPDRIRLGVYFGGASQAVDASPSNSPTFNLPNRVAPGASVTIRVTIAAPPKPGNYVLRQSLLKGDSLWLDLLPQAITVVATPLNQTNGRPR